MNPNTLPCSWRGERLEMEAWDCPRCKVTMCNHPEINKPTTANKWREDQSKIASCIRCPLRNGGPGVAFRISTETSSPTSGGPGTELRAVLQENGVDAAWCEGCKGHAKAMDQWGVEGCERHRESIVAWLRESAKEVNWLAKGAIALSLACKPWFNPFSPFQSLVNEAIRRAQEKENENQSG